MNLDISLPLVVKKKNKTTRIIKAGNWWINRNTPVGEDAEVWEQKPYNGRRYIHLNDIVKPQPRS